MIDLEAIAKDAAERVHKNGGCVPQLAFAPILFALQDALSTTTPARAEVQDEGAAGEPVAWQAMKDGRPLGSVWPYSDRCGADLWLAGGVGDEVRPLYAHPFPTPAADADRVRIAVEALDRVRDDLYFDGLDAESQYAVEQALAALKSTAAKEGGE